jgi:hypothetical protein
VQVQETMQPELPEKAQERRHVEPAADIRRENPRQEPVGRRPEST